MDRWIDGWVSGWVDVRMGGWMCEWMDGLIGGWIDGIRRRVKRPDKNEGEVNEVQSRRTWTRPENVR